MKSVVHGSSNSPSYVSSYRIICESVPIDEDDGIANKTITDVEGITHTAEEEARKKVESEENPVACAIELTTLKIPLSFFSFIYYIRSK